VKPPNRKPARLSVIRKRYTYEVGEIAKLLGVCKGTVRHWIKAGLKPIDTSRPLLIKGEVLSTFLSARRETRRTKCQPNEMYCLRCREPRQPLGLMVDVTLRNEKTAQLSGICGTCDARLNRAASVINLAETLKAFDQYTLRNPHLLERLPPSLSYHFPEHEKA
jgi:hypothetical protein